MPKRLALYLDGTWNTVISNTNVWRLRSLTPESPEQLVYYEQGVGTAFGEKVRGGMLGYGLDREVVEAYEWLMTHYEPGDELFMFGFSRGAYTARSLAGLVSKCGLLEPGAPLGVGQLYQRYRSKAPRRTIRALKNEGAAPAEDVEERWMIAYSEAIPVRFIGVWDTVGSLGVPFGAIPVLSSSNYAFLETDLRINETCAYHALAIDEHRESFRPTLWSRTTHPDRPQEDFPARPLTNVEQRWFVGAHANVGGGYDNDLLAQTPLRWMMEKAAGHGLTFRRQVVVDEGATAAAIANSYGAFMGGWYSRIPRNAPFRRPVGLPPTSIGAGVVRENINETIDATVFERWRADRTYRPQGVSDWANRLGVDPASLKSAVLAVDGRPVPEAPSAVQARPNLA